MGTASELSSPADTARLLDDDALDAGTASRSGRSSADAVRRGETRASRLLWQHRRRGLLWGGRALLLLLPLAVVTQYLLSQHGSASPSCPDPFNERPEPALLQRQSRSISVPTLSPAFTLSLAHDLSTCNSFELVFSRTDSTKCSHAEKHVHPSLDKDLNKWIKSRLGPDTISVQVEGAERQLLDVPSEYLGNCSYAYRFNLMNSGKAWVTAELLHEDYQGFYEPREVPVSRPAPILVREPLLRRPLELDLCPSRCAPHVPSPDLVSPLVIDESSFSSGLMPEGSSEDDGLTPVPSCDSSTPMSGAYIPLSPYAMNHPGASQPPAARSASLRRSSAGLYAYHRPACAMDHAGTRFADHAPCTRRDERVLFLGDSHGRAAFDVVKVRLEGGGAVASSSVKMEMRNATIGNLFMEFIWDPFLIKPLTCELVGTFDALVVSAGTHTAAFDCPTTSKFLSYFSARLSSLSDLLRTCRPPSAAPGRLVFLTMPVQHQHLHDHDCRTGPRVSYWNAELARIARAGGWEVVDVEEYSKPNAVDQRIMDGIHYLMLDAAEPIADDLIDRLEICDVE